MLKSYRCGKEENNYLYFNNKFSKEKFLNFLDANNIDERMFAITHNNISKFYGNLEIKEEQIESIDWLCFDFDPIRNKDGVILDNQGISATIKEFKETKKAARWFIQKIGISKNQYFEIETGNGIHILLKIHTIKNNYFYRCLIPDFYYHWNSKIKKKFPFVKLDTDISFSSAITKLAGTKSYKGVDCNDRFNRYARIVNMPKKIVPFHTNRLFKGIIGIKQMEHIFDLISTYEKDPEIVTLVEKYLPEFHNHYGKYHKFSKIAFACVYFAIKSGLNPSLAATAAFFVDPDNSIEKSKDKLGENAEYIEYVLSNYNKEVEDGICGCLHDAVLLFEKRVVFEYVKSSKELKTEIGKQVFLLDALYKKDNRKIDLHNLKLLDCYTVSKKIKDNTIYLHPDQNKKSFHQDKNNFYGNKPLTSSERFSNFGDTKKSGIKTQFFDINIKDITNWEIDDESDMFYTYCKTYLIKSESNLGEIQYNSNDFPLNKDFNLIDPVQKLTNNHVQTSLYRYLHQCPIIECAHESEGYNYDHKSCKKILELTNKNSIRFYGICVEKSTIVSKNLINFCEKGSLDPFFFLKENVNNALYIIGIYDEGWKYFEIKMDAKKIEFYACMRDNVFCFYIRQSYMDVNPDLDYHPIFHKIKLKKKMPENIDIYIGSTNKEYPSAIMSYKLIDVYDTPPTIEEMSEIKIVGQ